MTGYGKLIAIPISVNVVERELRLDEVIGKNWEILQVIGIVKGEIVD